MQKLILILALLFIFPACQKGETEKTVVVEKQQPEEGASIKIGPDGLEIKSPEIEVIFDDNDSNHPGKGKGHNK